MKDRYFQKLSHRKLRRRVRQNIHKDPLPLNKELTNQWDVNDYKGLMHSPPVQFNPLRHTEEWWWELYNKLKRK